MGKGRNKKFTPKVETKDEDRYIVVNAKSGEQIYPGPGVSKYQAEQLSNGLFMDSKIVLVEE